MLWIGFLLSGPVLCIVVSFVIACTGNCFCGDGSLPPISYAFWYAPPYYLALTGLTFWGFFKSWRLAVTSSTTMVVSFLSVLLSLRMAIAVGFLFHVLPERRFLERYCHPRSFVQDGKVYYLGMCDLQYYDKAGDTWFSYVYDTSKDIENDQKAKYANRTKDRREFVNAIRAYVNDDPNNHFEFADFYARYIYGDLYEVEFNDATAQGFTNEYGPPPPNQRNPYTPEH